MQVVRVNCVHIAGRSQEKRADCCEPWILVRYGPILHSARLGPCAAGGSTYNFYRPVDSLFRFQNQGGSGLHYGQYEQPLLPHTSHELSHSITAHSPSSSPPLSPQSPAKYCVNLRIISPSNKKEYTMFTLRDLRVNSVNTWRRLSYHKLGRLLLQILMNFKWDFSENLKSYGSIMIVMLVMHWT